MTTATIRLPAPDRTRTAVADTASLLKTIRSWRSRARQRAHLLNLSVEQLDDIGVDPEAARAEAAKPFWRA